MPSFEMCFPNSPIDSFDHFERQKTTPKNAFTVIMLLTYIIEMTTISKIITFVKMVNPKR